MNPEALRAVLPPARLVRLDNGLTLCLLDQPRAAVVATALLYRAGARDDPAGHGGTAHFLEHMMFKGAGPFGAGEIDRLTRRLGGSNNAFTSHDCTVYHFTFAADRWQRALRIERARMEALDLAPAEVANERRVILEEVAMFEDEPWDALEQAVHRAFFPHHPYGRPVLGTPAELAAIDADTLRAFHRRCYRPANAVLVLAGAFGDGALAAAREAFEPLPGPAAGTGGSGADRGEDRGPRSLLRLERRHGELARLLLALPSPAGNDLEHAVLHLLITVLGGGRASRLHRALVDEGQLCAWVSVDLDQTLDRGTAVIAAEVLPGVAPERVEAALFAELARLRAEPPSVEEVTRARRLLAADWVFAHERVYQQALAACAALVFDDLEHPFRYLARIADADAGALHAAAERYLRPETGAVLGWSLPRAERGG